MILFQEKKKRARRKNVLNGARKNWLTASGLILSFLPKAPRRASAFPSDFICFLKKKGCKASGKAVSRATIQRSGFFQFAAAQTACLCSFAPRNGAGRENCC